MERKRGGEEGKERAGGRGRAREGRKGREGRGGRVGSRLLGCQKLVELPQNQIIPAIAF